MFQVTFGTQPYILREGVKIWYVVRYGLHQYTGRFFCFEPSSI